MAGHSERIVFERAGGYPSVHALGLPGVPGCMHSVYQVVPRCTRCTMVFQVYQGVPRCTRCTRLHALGLTCRLCILTTTSVQTVVRSSSKTKAFCKQIVPHIQRIRHSLHHTAWTTHLILLCVTLCYFAIMHRSKDLGSCSNHRHWWHYLYWSLRTMMLA